MFLCKNQCLHKRTSTPSDCLHSTYKPGHLGVKLNWCWTCKIQKTSPTMLQNFWKMRTSPAARQDPGLSLPSILPAEDSSWPLGQGMQFSQGEDQPSHSACVDSCSFLKCRKLDYIICVSRVLYSLYLELGDGWGRGHENQHPVLKGKEWEACTTSIPDEN